MKRIHLSVLGTPSISVDGIPLSGLGLGKRLVLLAFLIEQPTPVSREHLANLFWPNSSRADAYGSLRQALAVIRQALAALGAGEALVADRSTVFFSRNVCNFKLDTEEYRRGLAARKEGIRHTDACCSLACKLIELYRGEYLQDVKIDNAPELEARIQSYRYQFGKLHSRFIEELGRCIECCDHLRCRELYSEKVVEWSGHAEFAGEMCVGDVHKGTIITAEANRRSRRQQRKIVVLCCDTRPVLAVYANAVGRLIQANSGTLREHLPGQPMIAYFTGRQSIETTKRLAINLAQQISKAGGRIALHAGEAIVSENGQTDKRGELAYTAWRLLERSLPGRVVVSANFRGGGFAPYTFTELAAIAGVSQCYSIADEVPALPASDEMVPLVGRGEELKLILGWHSDATAPPMLLLNSEQGGGKSRLVREVLRILCAPNAEIAVYVTRCCQEQSRQPFQAIVQTLQHCFELKVGSDIESLVRSWYPGEMPPAIPNIVQRILAPDDAFFTPLIPLPAPLRLSMAQMFANAILGCEPSKIIWVWEDIHCADASSLDVLDCVLRSAGRRVKIIGTANATVRGDIVSQATIIQLLPLSPAESCELLRRHCPELVEEPLLGLSELAGGNPLYLEELALLQRYAPLFDYRSGNHNSLTNVILARLAPFRNVAEIAAVLGEDARHDWLIEIARGRPDVAETELAKALESGVLVKRSDKGRQIAYSFRHDLLRLAILAGLVPMNRRALHSRIVVMLVQRYPRIAEKRPETVAHHLAEAGLYLGAVAWRVRAARLAVWFGALADARSQYLEALRILHEKREEGDLRIELGIQLELGFVTQELLGFGVPDSKNIYQRALRLARTLGCDVGRFNAMRGLIVCSPDDSNLASLYARRELLRLAHVLRRPLMQATAHNIMADALLNLGRLDAAYRHMLSAYECYRACPVASSEWQGDEVPQIAENQGCLALARLSFIDFLRSDSENSAQHFAMGLKMAQDIERPENEAFVRYCAAMTALVGADYSSLDQHATALSEIATKHGLRMWRGVADVCVLLVAGRADVLAQRIRASTTVTLFSEYPKAAPWIIFATVRRLFHDKMLAAAAALLPDLRKSISDWGVFVLVPYYLAVTAHLADIADRPVEANSRRRWALIWAGRHGYRQNVANDIARLRKLLSD